MGYLNGVWSNLVFNTDRTISQWLDKTYWQRQRSSGGLNYVSRSAYKSVFVHVARQFAMSTLENELSNLLPKYQKYISQKRLADIRKKQAQRYQTLLVNGQKSTEGFGRIMCQGNHELIAQTKNGTPVPEALILSYEGEGSVRYEFKDPLERTEGNAQAPGFSTKTVVHIDLAPKVSMNSTKNIVTTQVQGRDFSRKELVSGGDLVYTVHGSIASNEAGVYPVEAVKRFVAIMQHPGIVNVNFITFGLLGVKHIIIKNFSLNEAEYKNIQPYSFTCVAVEPDEAIVLQTDTIASINQGIESSQQSSWYHTILDNKLAQITANSVLHTATNAATSYASEGLDSLVSNI